jgi:NAD(P)-dependent dehydrogenase (short-subunit alcohol dehydrogenase family)
MTGEQWQRIMAVNLLAPIRLVHELLPLLLVAEEAHILNVSSMFGLATWRKTAAYQTSKFGLVGFSAALRAEYCSDTFGVTALCPGFRAVVVAGSGRDRQRRPAARRSGIGFARAPSEPPSRRSAPSTAIEALSW